MCLSRDIAEDALRQLYSVATVSRREGMTRYFTTSMHCIGASVPQIRSVARQASWRLRNASKGEIMDFARHLLSTDAMEARQLAYEVIACHRVALESLTVAEVEELGKGNDNWGTVDAFATLITGVLWLRGRLHTATIGRWARSANLWWRRTAIVSTVPLNLRSRGGTGDVGRTLQVVDRVKDDRHPTIAKAVSWALRSLATWYPEAVREYLAENAGLLPALVRREVRRKLDTGLKSPRKIR